MSNRTPAPDRTYVAVASDFDRVGYITPRAIIWEDGRRFDIETILSHRPASLEIPGVPGDCYTVLIHGEKKYLFFERIHGDTLRPGRWWAESRPA